MNTERKKEKKKFPHETKQFNRYLLLSKSYVIQ